MRLLYVLFTFVHGVAEFLSEHGVPIEAFGIEAVAIFFLSCVYDCCFACARLMTMEF